MENIKRKEWIDLDYQGWLNFFQENDKTRLIINSDLLGTLSKEEKDLIKPSITAFHQGENSEGRHLRNCAQTFKTEYKESIYPEVIDWFIKEENYHSSYLAIFMKGEGISPRKKNILDKIFTKIRQKGGLESEVITLVTAEIIALTYYDLLGRATDSLELKRICAQMLHDELPHIVFQSYTISHFKQTRLLNLKRKMIMELATITVYIWFYKFFKTTACKFSEFRKENFGYLKQSKEIVNELTNKRK